MAKAKKKGGGKRARVRDYPAEYARRKARARALLGEAYTTSAARGHPRRDKGELGVREIAQMRRAARVASPWEAARAAGKKKPGAPSHVRVTSARRLAEYAGVVVPPTWEARDRAKTQRERFVEAFMRLGLGSKREAYTLWFSP